MVRALGHPDTSEEWTKSRMKLVLQPGFSHFPPSRGVLRVVLLLWDASANQRGVSQEEASSQGIARVMAKVDLGF